MKNGDGSDSGHFINLSGGRWEFAVLVENETVTAWRGKNFSTEFLPRAMAATEQAGSTSKLVKARFRMGRKFNWPDSLACEDEVGLRVDSGLFAIAMISIDGIVMASNILPHSTVACAIPKSVLRLRTFSLEFAPWLHSMSELGDSGDEIQVRLVLPGLGSGNSGLVQEHFKMGNSREV